METKRGRELTQVELGALLREAESSPYALAYRIALETGMRPIEIVALRTEDIDTDGNVIHSHLSGRMRDIPMSPELATLIADYNAGESGFLFSTASGDPIDTNALRQDFAKVADAAGVDASIIDLRETFAAIAIGPDFWERVGL